MKKNSFVIFLTATIQPGTFDFVGRANYQERESDYYHAIKFYMSMQLPLVFVDNSNFHSEKIHGLTKDYPLFEYHTFKSEKSIEGKGHGEIEIFDYALVHSEMLKKTDWIIKISGRYIIENISTFLSKIDLEGQEVFVNYTRNMRWADTRFILIKKTFYHEYFKPCVEKYLDEKNMVLLEHIFARSVHLFQASGGEISIWPCYPFYNAHDGTNGEKVYFNYFKKFKYRFYFKLKSKILSHRV